MSFDQIVALAEASINETLASPWQIVAIVAVLVATALMTYSFLEANRALTAA